MPAETHQRGRAADAASVLELLVALLEDGAAHAGRGATFESLGVDAQGLGDLWQAVREELGERGLGPDLDPEVLEPSMTLEAAAEIMARLLGDGGDDGS